MKNVWGLLVLAVVLVLAGCGDKSASPASAAPETQKSADNIEEGSSSPAASPSSVIAPEEPVSPSTAAPAVVPSAPSSAEPAPSPSIPTEPAASAQPTPSAAQSPSPSKSPTPSPSATPKATQKQPDAKPPKASPEVNEATISIVGNAGWGTIVGADSIQLAEGDTAVSVLKRIAKAHRISYETTGSGELAYVQGIDGLYEFDDGPTSGWKYRVNGKVPDVGAGSYKLKPGDRLEWFYTSEDEAAKEDKGSSQ